MVNENSIDVSLFTVENEKSVSELFQSINSIHNDAEENEKIWSEISDKITDSVINSEEKNKNKMMNTYKVFLESLQSVVNKQLEEITSMIDETTFVDTIEKDFLDTLLEFREQKHQAMADILDAKELEIYDMVVLHDYIRKISERYSTPPDKYIHSLYFFNSWMEYFNMSVCMKNQKECDKKIVKNYMMRKHEDDFFAVKNSYEVYKIQGLLSTSIYQQRKKLGLTQKQLQERSGVDHTTIAKIEKLQQPTTLETAVKLLSSLNIEIGFCASSQDIS